MRLRIAAGAVLGTAAVLVAGPAGWMPWAGWVHAQMPAWWVLPAIASALLLAATACLPGRAADRPETRTSNRLQPALWPLQHRGATVALGLGLLLVLEPLLHLTVLGYLTLAPAPGSLDLLLPNSGGSTPGELARRIAVLCLLAPVAEELFFRGRLLPLLVPRIGAWGALTFTSLAFAVAHGSPITALVALPIGLLLGWLRLCHRDLGACVLVHQAHNGLFILAGPALVTAPLSAAVLAVGGALMLTLAALHTRQRWHALPAGLALAAAMALAVPPLLALKDSWWATSVARLAGRARTEPGLLIERLDLQRRRGRLTSARSDDLRYRLQPYGSDAARAARMVLEESAAQAASDDEAVSDLRAAIRVARPPDGLRAAACALGRQWPESLALIAIEDPSAIATLLGLDGAGSAIAAASGRPRKQLLGALEQAWPGRFASVLLALPAADVTGLERRHLRQHYADAEAMIAALDPARREAWK